MTEAYVPKELEKVYGEYQLYNKREVSCSSLVLVSALYGEYINSSSWVSLVFPLQTKYKIQYTKAIMSTNNF